MRFTVAPFIQLGQSFVTAIRLQNITLFTYIYTLCKIKYAIPLKFGCKWIYCCHLLFAAMFGSSPIDFYKL